MTPAERRKAISDFVLEQGEARIDTLVDHFGVSRMTIHRMIDELARQGVLRKLHGAVSAQPSAVYESLFTFRLGQAPDAKKRLANAAIELIEAGQSLIIDDSTTAHEIGPLLGAKTPISVVTNSLGLNTLLAPNEDISLLCTGGDFHPTYNAFIGHVCERTLDALRVNTFICSTSAVSDGIALIQDAALTRIKQAMFRAAETRILLVHSDKFEKRALHAFAALTEFDHVITDADLSDQIALPLIASGVNLMRVS